MLEIEKVSESTFQQQVLESSQPVLVDFTAVWCQPCKLLDPVVKQLAVEWGEHVKFFKLDVDDHPQLAIQYQVMGVPTLMLFKQGKPVERISGLQDKERLKKKFAPHLS